MMEADENAGLVKKVRAMERAGGIDRAALDELVLRPMEEGAFEGFLTIPPDDAYAVAQLQAMAKVVRQVRSTLDGIMNNGMYAIEQLRQNSTQEGET